MAGAPIAGNAYQSQSGLYIVTYVGDVTRAQADGIVVSEGTRFSGMGYVAATLLRMDSEFDTNRNKLIQKEKAHFEPWTAYTSGECANFTSVIHAIVLPREKKQNIHEWKVKMTSLYKKILREAEKKGVSILAVPLLGSGKGNVTPKDAAEVAVHAVFSYKKASLVKVLLVSGKEGIVDMLATQCAYLSSTKGGKALEPPQSHTKTGRKNGPKLHRPPPPRPPPPQPKLNGETDSNNSRRSKQVVDRSDPSSDSIERGAAQGGMALRSGRVLPSVPQNDDELSRYNRKMTRTGKTCKRTRGNELKRINGQACEDYCRTEVSEYKETRNPGTSLPEVEDFCGGAKPKVSNKAKRTGENDDDENDDDADDDGDEYSSLGSCFEGEDHDDCGEGGGTAAAAADAKTSKRLEGPKVTSRIWTDTAVESDEAILKDGLNDPDKGIDVTGDQMPREDRKRRGCNEKRTTGRASDGTVTHSKGNGSGSGKSTTMDHDDITMPMANLSISHTNEQVTHNKPTAQNCAICLEEISNPWTLHKCGHVFCKVCIDDCFARYKPVCPSCNMVYGVLTGNQPQGTMDVSFSGEHLPGYDTCGMITITYRFLNGTQTADHPNPGHFYKGTTRVAYLPDCGEGRDVLRLLRKAFDRKLTFTIGRSTTTGHENVVTWNDIHHKTSIDGGPTRFGYPDETYLIRVKEELASKGVTNGN